MRSLVMLGLCFTIVSADAAAQTIPRPKRRGAHSRVTFDSSPQQAAIYLDDKQYGIVGYTPYRGRLVRGQYKLIMELPGFKPIDRVITIGRGKNDFFFPLEKQVLPGTIDVQAVADPNLTGAQIFIDGQPKGTVPNAVEVPKGRHLLELKKPKFNDFAQWVQVDEGQRITIAPTLKSNAKGSLLIDADVQGASVSVDGRKLADSAPVLVDDLDEGLHVVEVSKPPATPWKQSVAVKAGVRTKITASLQASLTQAQGGSLRILANVPDAVIWVDGTERGKPPVDVSGLSAGQHILEARADGYVPKEQTIQVAAGSSSVVKIDLEEATGPRGPAGVLSISSTPVSDATVKVDGAVVGRTPWQEKVAAGDHNISVEHDGYAKFEEKVSVEAKKTMTVAVDLKPVGSVRILSTPEAADVFIDGERVGRTPVTQESVAVGDHNISFRLDGYRDAEQSVRVEGGQQAMVNEQLKPNSYLSPAEVAQVRRGLSSYGARTVPAGRFTVDASVGYPYWIETRATIGVSGLRQVGVDVTVGFRSLLTTWEFLVGGKVRFVRVDPFALAAFVSGGGGGGAAGRNEFSLRAGAVASLTFNNLVTVSARAFLDTWSDRLCKAHAAGSMYADTGPDVCQGPAKASITDLMQAQKLHGGEDLSTRDTGARFYLSVVVEAGIAENFNVFAVFEGAPFQDQRAAHSKLFTPSLLGKDDTIYNGRLGLTFKF